MFTSLSFKQLQNLVEKLGIIVADESTYLSELYSKSSGSYTRISWRYNNDLFSVEYPNSNKNKRGLHNVYMNTRKSLNAISLSINYMNTLSKDYIGEFIYQTSFVMSGNFLKG